MNPLTGKKIGITREKDQAEKFARLLALEGAVPFCIPVLAIAPFEDAEQSLEAGKKITSYDYLVFTSQNAVRYFQDWLRRKNLALGRSTLVFTVGEKTKIAAEGSGFQVSFCPDHPHATDEFFSELILNYDISGKKSLFPRAKAIRDNLVSLLKEKKASVDELVLYETVKNMNAKGDVHLAMTQGLDWLTFLSPSAVKAFFSLGGKQEVVDWVRSDQIKLASIGKITTQEIVKHGLSPSVECKVPSMEEMIRDIKFWEGKKK